MTRSTFADADGASWRTVERRRLADIEFLTALRTATHEELYAMVRNHAHKSTPQWKRVAR